MRLSLFSALTIFGGRKQEAPACVASPVESAQGTTLANSDVDINSLLQTAQTTL